MDSRKKTDRLINAIGTVAESSLVCPFPNDMAAI